MLSAEQLFAIALVFAGCCTNVVFLELIIKLDKGAGNLITLSQFLLVALEGLVVTSRFFTRKSVIPVYYYAIMVIMFFSVSITNNHALSFGIGLPLHMVFRSSSLVANMILGIIILRKSYAWPMYLGVFMITVGISTCTIVSGQSLDGKGGSTDLSTWLIGIGFLVFALFFSALMGIFQEVLYKQHGKHPREAMFWTHMLPLPGFLLLADNLREHVAIFSNSEIIQVPLLPAMPCLWLYLMGNVLTQYVCIRGVFFLTTSCPSLTVTLIITLRKFISLLFSIFYFQNPFTLSHWLGTLLVFGGTLLYMFSSHIVPPKKEEKKD